MRKQINRLKNGLSFWCAVYPAAILIIIGFILLRLIGWIRIRGLENFPRDQGSVLLISNHQSLWEPIILGALFLPRGLIHPIRGIPWFAPDKHNYVDKWYWGVFNSRFIPIARGKCFEQFRAAGELAGVLLAGFNAILFAEGSRTNKGKEGDFLFSVSGKRLRKLKRGVGLVICEADCTAVNVWVDGADKILPIGKWFPRVWRGMTISIGKPFRRGGMTPNEVVEYVSADLLALAG